MEARARALREKEASLIGLKERERRKLKREIEKTELERKLRNKARRAVGDDSISEFGDDDRDDVIEDTGMESYDSGCEDDLGDFAQFLIPEDAEVSSQSAAASAVTVGETPVDSQESKQ